MQNSVAENLLNTKSTYLNRLEELLMYNILCFETSNLQKHLNKLVDNVESRQVVLSDFSRDECGNTPLHFAATAGDIEKVGNIRVKLGKKWQYLVNDLNNDLYTPLMLASQAGHINVVNYLLMHCANCNLQGKAGATPLILSSFAGKVEVAKLLLEKGANVNLRNTDGYDALFHAAEQGDIEMFKLFANCGADVYTYYKNYKDGRAAFEILALTGKCTFVQAESFGIKRYCFENSFSKASIVKAVSEAWLCTALYFLHDSIVKEDASYMVMSYSIFCMGECIEILMQPKVCFAPNIISCCWRFIYGSKEEEEVVQHTTASYIL